jgi:hypothetical protein
MQTTKTTIWKKTIKGGFTPMRANFLSCAGLCAGALFLSPSIALANMGNTATTYGLLPTDIASAQALSQHQERADRRPDARRA